MRNILWLIQGRYDPTEAYYRQFEAAISTSGLEKYNATTQIELNKAYVDGDNEYITKRLHAMCLIISADSDRYSGIWNNIKNSTLLGTDNYPKTTTAAYYVLCHYKKPLPPRQVHAPPASVTFVQIGDTYKNKTTPGNVGIYFP